MIKLFTTLRDSELAKTRLRLVTDKEARAAAATKKLSWEMPRVKQGILGRQKPTRWLGQGEPIMVGHGD